MAQAFDPVDRIVAFLTQFVSLGQAERQLIRQLTRIEHYPKGTLLLADSARPTSVATNVPTIHSAKHEWVPSLAFTRDGAQ